MMKLLKYSVPLSGVFLFAYGSLATAARVIIIKEPAPVYQETNPYIMIPPPPPNVHYFWKLAEAGNIPPHAVVGGQEGRKLLFICQGFYNGSVHPGKVVAGRCNITYGGAEIPRDNFRVLVGEGLGWVTVKHGRIPPNAVPGGFENGGPLFICHAQYGFRGVHPGKVVAGACNIGYGGQEIVLYNYQILVD